MEERREREREGAWGRDRGRDRTREGEKERWTNEETKGLQAASASPSSFLPLLDYPFPTNSPDPSHSVPPSLPAALLPFLLFSLSVTLSRSKDCLKTPSSRASRYSVSMIRLFCTSLPPSLLPPRGRPLKPFPPDCRSLRFRLSSTSASTCDPRLSSLMRAQLAHSFPPSDGRMKNEKQRNEGRTEGYEEGRLPLITWQEK